MVTAGVYLIVRAHPVFELAPTIADLAAGLGAITLLVAGLVALVQTDIKRVIAYSTMSQIGYMFLGAGLGAYGNGMFHLMTHAFFKALLFMAAGLVIHHLAGEQDIRQMGGLRHAMPQHVRGFLVGSLALVGIPPLSGFFSKDSILASALASGGYGVVLFVAGLARRAPDRHLHVPPALRRLRRRAVAARDRARHGHGHGEGPWTMTWAVGVLAVLAVVGGWIQVAGIWHPFGEWLDPIAVARAPPRRADRDAGLRHECARGRARPRRDRGRLGPLRAAPPGARPASVQRRSSTSSGSTSSTTRSSTGRRLLAHAPGAASRSR